MYFKQQSLIFEKIMIYAIFYVVKHRSVMFTFYCQ